MLPVTVTGALATFLIVTKYLTGTAWEGLVQAPHSNEGLAVSAEVRLQAALSEVRKQECWLLFLGHFHCCEETP